MDFTRTRFYKPLLLVLAVCLLAGSGVLERRMDRTRDELGLPRGVPLKDAPPMPPVLAFTTVALGGFRGLIANALWVRANDLQDEGKYFEMVQLADWITKLQPHFKAVWIFQAWNMAYNISIKFSDPRDRWHWVRRGLELLRDEALKYNPHEALLYRELAWFFQHKMGQNLDDAHLYFKQAWALEMTAVLGDARPNWDELLRPSTPEARARVETLRTKFKLDPALLKEVDDKYGPLEWRLPEAHALYWAVKGLREAKPEELITLRRVIYQSMQLAFYRGHLIVNRYEGKVGFGPNLDILDKTNAAYEEMMRDDVQMRDNIGTAHKNFLMDAVYFLYSHSRLREAEKWFAVLKQRYPDRAPAHQTLDEYALSRIREDMGETSMDRITMIVQGYLANSFFYLGLDEDDQAAGLAMIARTIYNRYQRQIVDTPSKDRVGLPPFAKIRQEVLDRVLDPQQGLNPGIAAVVRTKLNLPPPSTNAPPVPSVPALGTNLPPVRVPVDRP